MRWPWITAGAVVCAGAGLWLGLALWPTQYRAVARVGWIDSAGPRYQPRQLAPAGLAALAESGEIRQRVRRAVPDFDGTLQAAVPWPGVVEVAAAGATSTDVAAAAQLAAVKMVEWATEQQMQSALEETEVELRLQLLQIESDLTQAVAQLRRETQPEESLILRYRIQGLEQQRLAILARQRETAVYARHPAGSYRVLVTPREADVVVQPHWRQRLWLAALAGLVGALATAMFCIGRRSGDVALETAGDVRCATGLPVLAVLRDLGQPDEAEPDRQVTEIWREIERRAEITGAFNLVCGLTSSHAGEGRSAWIKLLGQAAGQSGHRVLTVLLRRHSANHAGHVNGAAPSPPGALLQPSVDIVTDVLAAPERVTEVLGNGNVNQPASVDVILHDGAWDAIRVRQWKQALAEWRSIHNVVILVELPPAARPELTALARTLPNLVWLVRRGRARAGESRAQVRRLQRARCRFLGAVLNEDSTASQEQLLSRWWN